jgi:hypothetical protein
MCIQTALAPMNRSTMTRCRRRRGPSALLFVARRRPAGECWRPVSMVFERTIQGCRTRSRRGCTRPRMRTPPSHRTHSRRLGAAACIRRVRSEMGLSEKKSTRERRRTVGRQGEREGRLRRPLPGSRVRRREAGCSSAVFSPSTPILKHLLAANARDATDRGGLGGSGPAWPSSVINHHIRRSRAQDLGKIRLAPPLQTANRRIMGI